MIYSLNSVRTTGYSFGKDNKVKLPVETKINSRWIKYVIEKQAKKELLKYCQMLKYCR